MTESSAPLDFFDTSAFIKHYVEELGSEVVDRAFDDPDNIRLITDLTVIEFHSAFARRVRMGELEREDFEDVQSALEADIREGRLQVEGLSESDKVEATRLIQQYGLSRELRTLDAMQLAVMKRLGAATLRTVYCADRTLVSILETEGFTVIDPEASFPES